MYPIYFIGYRCLNVFDYQEKWTCGRLKGFGCTEFPTRQDLVDALTMNELIIKNRKIRVDFASGADGDKEQGAGGMGRGRGRPSRNDEEREDHTPSDWRNAPMEEPPQCQDRGDAGGFRGGDKGGDRTERGIVHPAQLFHPREIHSVREETDHLVRSVGAEMAPQAQVFCSRDREGGSFGGRDRYSPSSFGGRNREGGSSFFSCGRDGPSSFGQDREGDGSWYGRDRDGPSSFGHDRESPSFNGDEMKRSERPNAGEEGSDPVAEIPATAAVAAPIKRSVATAAPPSSASIFGAAKPVETAARERTIEERIKEKQMKEKEQPLSGRVTVRQE
uniref:Uncharacterized protein n=1 Tax=Daphnia galeata TaxID=27404 RepID=A0A8J2RYG1_9CRUS|nr:unnamed protein product [Daphnia galeata]